MNSEQQATVLEIAQVMHRWHEAVKNGDRKTLGEMMANEYSSISPSGEVMSRDEELALVESSDVQFQSLVTDQLKVKLYGDAAVVSGRTLIEGTHQGADIGGEVRYTAMLVRRDGHWVVVASQGTEAG